MKDIVLGLRKMWSLPASFDIALPTQHRAGSIYQLIGIRDRETASLSLKYCRNVHLRQLRESEVRIWMCLHVTRCVETSEAQRARHGSAFGTRTEQFRADRHVPKKVLSLIRQLQLPLVVCIAASLHDFITALPGWRQNSFLHSPTIGVARRLDFSLLTSTRLTNTIVRPPSTITTVHHHRPPPLPPPLTHPLTNDLLLHAHRRPRWSSTTTWRRGPCYVHPPLTLPTSSWRIPA